MLLYYFIRSLHQVGPLQKEHHEASMFEPQLEHHEVESNGTLDTGPGHLDYVACTTKALARPSSGEMDSSA